ncbi:MAG: CPBP family intramembrane metalloprotease [Caldilineaceae bacterium]|nr:CPBP family intramembrane metalloprotease [Caldilineaceae bacterium]
MAAIRSFIKRHPLLTYFALVFAISWGGFIIVIGPGNLPMTTMQFETLGPVVYLLIFAGPSIAGLLVISLVFGQAGLRELLAHLLRWRVDARWYALALLATPLLAATVNFALALLSPAFLPGIFTADDKASLLLFGITMALLVGFFEELGWTGFAIPMLRQRYGILATGLIVGLIWGAWHFLLFWESDSFSGAFPLALLLVRLFAWLPAYRVLMVWVYDHTESLLVAMLMHTSLVASQLILMPLTTGEDTLTGILVWAAVLWIVVAAVAVANHGHLSRQPFPKEMSAMGH